MNSCAKEKIFLDISLEIKSYKNFLSSIFLIPKFYINPGPNFRKLSVFSKSISGKIFSCEKNFHIYQV